MTESNLNHFIWALVVLVCTMMLTFSHCATEEMRYAVLNKMQDASLRNNPAFEGSAERGKHGKEKEKVHKVQIHQEVTGSEE